MSLDSPKAYRLETRLGPMAVLLKNDRLMKSILPCPTSQALEILVAQEWQVDLSNNPSVLCLELSNRIDAMWQGEREDFLDLALDLENCTAFQQSVYESLRTIPQAHVVSYGELARRLGKPQAARAVGGALRVNPLPLFIPCHRVLAKVGIGGFTAPGGLGQKYTLLRAEGFEFADDAKAFHRTDMNPFPS